MPFKEEDINSEPFVKIYHDVLYDDEILKIKVTSLATVSIFLFGSSKSLLLSNLDQI